MNRINKIATYIDDNDLVADIGCDQAQLSIILAKKHIFSIGIDIKKNIIDKCKEKIIEQNLDKYINLRVGNGINLLSKKEVDTLVFAGLGTYTIINILKNSIDIYKKIITISNNNHKLLRENMLELGYKIYLEEIIFEKNKFYNLIIFIPGIQKYTKEELYIGFNHKNMDLLKIYHNNLLKKYNKFYEKNAELKELINIIKNYKY